MLAVVLNSRQGGGDGALHRIYNLGSGCAKPLQSLVDAVATATGREVFIEKHPHQPGDVKHTCADISKIQAEYGFSPETVLSEGVSRFVDWFNSSPEFASI